ISIFHGLMPELEPSETIQVLTVDVADGGSGRPKDNDQQIIIPAASHRNETSSGPPRGSGFDTIKSLRLQQVIRVLPSRLAAAAIRSRQCRAVFPRVHDLLKQ